MIVFKCSKYYFRIILDTNNELKQPVVKLSLIEPSADLYLRRHSIASSDVYKRAFRRPRITVSYLLIFIFREKILILIRNSLLGL